MVQLDAVVVFSGGPFPDPGVRAFLPEGAPVVAADRGADHARSLGFEVAVLVGDLDSVSPDTVEELHGSGARLERHSAAKEATDLELALATALRLNPARVLVVGGVGGRLDHLLGELLCLCADAWAPVEIDAFFGRSRAHVVRSERVLRGTVGELISLYALGGDAHGVVTEGLAYPLRDETLRAGSTRGLSNVFASEQARVALSRGVVLALRPEAAESPPGSGAA